MPTLSRHSKTRWPLATAIAVGAILSVPLVSTINAQAPAGPPVAGNGYAPIAPVRANASVPQSPAFVPIQPGTFGVGGTPPATAQLPPGSVAPRFAGQVPTPGRVPQQPGFAPQQPGYAPQQFGGAPPTTAAAPASFAPDQLRSLEGSTIIARVGNDVVLAGEVLPAVYAHLAKNADKIPAGKEAEIMQLAVTGALERVISRKVLYVSAKQQVPEENLGQVDEQLGDAFAESLADKFAGKKKGSDLGDLIAGAEVTTRTELEAYLISKGSYLAQEERAFKERSLASYAMQGQIEEPGEVTRHEMLTYYREHIADFQYSAQSRWEQLSVRFSRVSDRYAAGEAIRAMGNRVWLQNEPFAKVAKESSHGSTASDGGQHDWTGKGSLRSTVLNEAIFSQRVGQLGQILEDKDGFHIVRVIERTEEGVKPFLDEQEAIAKTIIKARQDGQYEAAFERLKAKVPVWTVFDDEATAKQFIAVAAQPLLR